jgi:hypothetical protein
MQVGAILDGLTDDALRSLNTTMPATINEKSKAGRRRNIIIWTKLLKPQRCSLDLFTTADDDNFPLWLSSLCIFSH